MTSKMLSFHFIAAWLPIDNTRIGSNTNHSKSTSVYPAILETASYIISHADKTSYGHWNSIPDSITRITMRISIDRSDELMI